MIQTKTSFFARLVLAWRTLVDAQFAAAVTRLIKGEASAPEVPRPGEVKPAPSKLPASSKLKEVSPESALQILGLLQQQGRFLDFIQEDVSAFTDADIGGAARVVHEGCRKAIHQHLELKPVRSEQEGARITLQEGFDASAMRLTGNVVGQPPFTGTLAHRGWRVTQIKLPKITDGHDVNVLAPAEVEL